MDFVYDLTEKFEQQKIDYFLVTVRRGKEKDTADVFYNFRHDRSIECLLDVLKSLNEEEITESNDDKPKDGKSNKKTPPRKREPKKRPPRKRRKPPKDKGGDK